MTIKARLARLEKVQTPAPQLGDIESIRARIMAKLDAAINGEILPEAQPFNPLRAEILRRLERLANEQLNSAITTA